MKTKFGIAVISALVLSTISLPAMATDSVRLPGDLTTAQCPQGFQYSIGIEVNVTTHERFTWCNSAPNQADLMIRSWDEQFRKDQDAAQAVALQASQEWNAKNPGKQLCFTWGPVKHPSGVGEASGGVCANPVAVVSAPIVSAPIMTPPVVEPIVEVVKVQKAKKIKKAKKKAKKTLANKQK